ncbi:MAG: hypothetical protein LBS04_00970 [Tannerellaceae bacterium]|nr:hypothetical protein [Tannerellaceae bacterium]
MSYVKYWTSAGTKSNNVWLIYAWHRETGGIVAFVWGKRELETAKKMKQKWSDSGGGMQREYSYR